MVNEYSLSILSKYSGRAMPPVCVVSVVVDTVTSYKFYIIAASNIVLKSTADLFV